MICLTLFWTFFKIGLFTFGGGYAMLPLIQEEVAAHGWMGNAELVNFVAVSESTPGPFAVNISTYIGTRLAGIPGALCATLGAVLPSFLIILVVARCYDKFRTNKIVSGCMEGLKSGVIGLIAAAAVSVGNTVFFPDGFRAAAFAGAPFWLSLAVFAVMLVLALRRVHPIALICLSAAIGIAAGYALDLPA
jgi:chromate transporter